MGHGTNGAASPLAAQRVGAPGTRSAPATPYTALPPPTRLPAPPGASQPAPAGRRPASESEGGGFYNTHTRANTNGPCAGARRGGRGGTLQGGSPHPPHRPPAAARAPVARPNCMWQRLSHARRPPPRRASAGEAPRAAATGLASNRRAPESFRGCAAGAPGGLAAASCRYTPPLQVEGGRAHARARVRAPVTRPAVPEPSQTKRTPPQPPPKPRRAAETAPLGAGPNTCCARGAPTKRNARET